MAAETIDEIVRRVAKEEARKEARSFFRESLDSRTHENATGDHANRCNVCDRVFASPHAVRVHHGKTDCGLVGS